MTLKELLAALRKATGRDRELNFRIAEMLGDVPVHTVRKIGWDYDWYRAEGEFTLYRARDSEGRNFASWAAPDYTGNLAVALTLVPNGWKIANLGQKDDDSWWCELRHPHITSFDRIAIGLELTPLTPEIAVCIASLEARLLEDTK